MTVDGVDCPVKSWDDKTITCITGAKPVMSAPQPGYPGEHGIYRIYAANKKRGLTRDNIAEFEVIRTLLTTPEIPSNSFTTPAESLMQGFYEAPVDGDYQFHMACDDTCDLWFALDDPMNPESVEIILNR